MREFSSEGFVRFRDQDALAEASPARMPTKILAIVVAVFGWMAASAMGVKLGSIPTVEPSGTFLATWVVVVAIGALLSLALGRYD